MRYITSFVIFSFLISVINCQSQKGDNKLSTMNIKNEKISKIELTESTRGTKRTITFTNISLVTDVNGKIKSSSISKPEWESIVKETQAISLEKIPTYVSPTTNRYSDAAFSSIITISTVDKKYNSVDFDAGTPPKELEKLYKKLLDVRGTTN